MNILIEKSNKGFSIDVTTENTKCHFDGISSDDLKNIKTQIDEVLKQPKSKIMVWNPRSRKHDIIEE